MKRIGEVGAIWALGCCLAACGGGGGGGGNDGSSGNAPAGATTYTPGRPVAGSQDVFVTTRVDDSGNTIAGTYTEQVASVGTDGSYTLTKVDPTGDSPIVNGIDYHFNATTLEYDSHGGETGSTDTSDTGAVQTCTYATESGGLASPLWVGESFTATVREDCSPGSLQTITEDGSVAALESVTVPAGTFSSLKLQTTSSFTDANGQVVTEQITHWVDPAHYLFTIKEVVTYTRSGNVPAHYVTSETIELQSRSGT